MQFPLWIPTITMSVTDVTVHSSANREVQPQLKLLHPETLNTVS